MDIRFQILTDLIIDGSVSASKNKKVPKAIRYLLIFFVVLFFLLVVGAIIGMGIFVLKSDPIAGVALIILGIMSAIISIIKFKNIYINKKNND